MTVGGEDLETEVANLREQVKSLVRIESKLHRAQTDLDFQLKIFRGLHDLGLRINIGFDLDRILRAVIEFAVYELGYERCMVLLDHPRSGRDLRVHAHDGYFGAEWEARIQQVRISLDDPLVRETIARKQLIHSADAPLEGIDPQLPVELGMGEFLAFALIDVGNQVLGLMIAGNSAEKRQHYAPVAEKSNSTYGLASLSAQAAAAINSALGHQELQNERNLLEGKVEERTRELARALSDLEQLDQAKSQFFANVSHELRTPLTLSVAPLEQILFAPDRPAMVEQQHRHLLVVYNNQLRLLKLINNLLDVAKIDAGKMTARFERIDAVQALRFYLGTLASAAEARRIELSFVTDLERIDLYLAADPFEKIVMNLLSNAFKFTPDGGAIAVNVTDREDAVAIAVADTGIGIPESAMPRLFERFMQAEASDKRRYEGSGIGLALVKDYVALHGGTVEVDSEVGVGTTFTITLLKGTAHLPPDAIDSEAERAISDLAAYHTADFRAPAAEEEDIDDDTQETTPAEVRAAADGLVLLDDHDVVASDGLGGLVLVVDDVDDMRRFIAHLLRRFYRVKTARDGLEGLEVARRTRPDLIVSDVMMPRMTGNELCRAVKADPELASTPVILVSAKAELSHKLEGLEHGADDYLVKPFNANELGARVKNLLRLRRQERALREMQLDLIDARRQALEAEVDMARRVQLQLLPDHQGFADDGVELWGFLRSASECSGDFWTYQRLSDGRVLIAVGDVTGHGMASALVAEMAFGALVASVHTSRDVTPSGVLAAVNAVLCRNRSEMAMTMVVAIVDGSGVATLSGAGHPPIISSGHPRLIGSRSPLLGLRADVAFLDHRIEPNGDGAGTRLLLYSDGIPEARDARGRPFGMRSLINAFRGAVGVNGARGHVEAVRSRLDAFLKGVEPEDDVTAVAVVVGAS